MHSILTEKEVLSQDHGEWSDFLRLLVWFINSYSLPYIHRSMHLNIKSSTCVTDEKNVVKIQQETSLWDLLWVCTSTKHLLWLRLSSVFRVWPLLYIHSYTAYSIVPLSLLLGTFPLLSLTEHFVFLLIIKSNTHLPPLALWASNEKVSPYFFSPLLLWVHSCHL